MPNVMATLLNIGGALCSTLQSLADAHYWSAVQQSLKYGRTRGNAVSGPLIIASKHSQASHSR